MKYFSNLVCEAGAAGGSSAVKDRLENESLAGTTTAAAAAGGKAVLDSPLLSCKLDRYIGGCISNDFVDGRCSAKFDCCL